MYHCRSDHVIKLICKLCSTEGHSIDACKLSMMLSNYCQYCQNMGHEVTQCLLLLQNTSSVGNVRKWDTIRLRAGEIKQEFRKHAKFVAARRTRLKIARQHCVRGATTSGI